MKTAALFVTRGMSLIKPNSQLFYKRTLVVNKEKNTRIVITHKTIPGSTFKSIVLEYSKEYSQNTAAVHNGNLRKPRNGNQL